jgi:alkanesulfonate monooxygenase SsuD/methylene tetrahydromethanopterin reductase-like flavin-dependent oxidoreductase (luciferase family)
MTSKIRFGLQLDFRNPLQWRRPWHQFYQEMIDFAVWTESLGFDSVWLSEHHGANDGYLPSPLIAASAIAAKTSTLRIGTAIAIAPLYHPVRFAEDSAVLDILSNGRLELGLAVGYRESEFLGYGQTLKSRGKQTDEMLEIVQRLWRGETFDYHGDFYQLTGACINPTPLQAQIPVYIGGFNQAALRRAARFGNGIIGGGDSVKRWTDYQSAMIAENRDPLHARLLYGLMWFIVSETPEQTWNRVAPHVLHQINSYAQWLKGTDHAIFKPMTLEQLKASNTLEVVTPNAAIEKITSLAQSAPVTDIYGMIPPAGFPLEELGKHIELFAKTVIPAFQ